MKQSRLVRKAKSTFNLDNEVHAFLEKLEEAGDLFEPIWRTMYREDFKQKLPNVKKVVDLLREIQDVTPTFLGPIPVTEDNENE